MKQAVSAAFLVLISATSLFAAQLRLENDRDSLVYYTIAELSELPAAGSGRSEALVTKLLADLPTAAYLPAGASQPNLAIPETPAVLVLMYLKTGGAWQFATLDLPPAGRLTANTFLSLSKAASLKNSLGQNLEAGPLELNMPKPVIRIDGYLIDWLTVPDSLQVEPNKPLAITRESLGQRLPISLAQAFTRNKGGTDLSRLKLTRDNRYLYLMANSYSAMGKGLSILLRIYRDDSDINPWTVEIPVRAAGGQVFLWSVDPAGRQVLTNCGDFNQIGLFLEARLSFDLLPQKLLETLQSSGGRLEIGTAFTDGSITEEWYYGSLSTKALSGSAATP